MAFGCHYRGNGPAYPKGGGVLTDFFLDHVPFFNQFRDTKMMLVLVHNSIAIGVVLILIEMGQLVRTGGEELKKRRNWFMGVMGLIISVFCGFLRTSGGVF